MTPPTAAAPPASTPPGQPLQSFDLAPDPAVFATPAGVPDTGFQLKPEVATDAGDVYTGPDPGDVYAGPDPTAPGIEPGAAAPYQGYVSSTPERDESPVMAISPEAPLSWRDTFYYPVRGNGLRTLVVGGALMLGSLLAIAMLGAPAVLIIFYGVAWITVAVLRSGAGGELELGYLPSPFDFYLRFRDTLTVMLGSLSNFAIELGIFYFLDPTESLQRGEYGIVAGVVALRFFGLFLSLIATGAAAIYDQPFLALRLDKHFLVLMETILDLFKMFAALVLALVVIICLIIGVNMILPSTLPAVGGLSVSLLAAFFAPIFIIMYLVIFMNFTLATIFRRHKKEIDRLYFYL